MLLVVVAVVVVATDPVAAACLFVCLLARLLVCSFVFCYCNAPFVTFHHRIADLPGKDRRGIF